MSEEVMQWLAEIRALKEQLAGVERDRDAALESAAHWRKLYNIEARQRRAETQFAKEEADRLQMELHNLQSGELPTPAQTPESDAAIAAEINSLQTLETLRRRLGEVMKERDRVREALKLEQENHQQTRKNLTAVIGDTIDQLARMRGEKGKNKS